MTQPYDSIDIEKIGYYITYIKDCPVEDIVIANKLHIPLEKYQQILISFGACCIQEYDKCYFENLEDANKCIQYLKECKLEVINMVDLLVKCGLAISKREARTLIKQGAISIIVPKNKCS
jgi:hypothetical protein